MREISAFHKKCGIRGKSDLVNDTAFVPKPHLMRDDITMESIAASKIRRTVFDFSRPRHLIPEDVFVFQNDHAVVLLSEEFQDDADLRLAGLPIGPALTNFNRIQPRVVQGMWRIEGKKFL